MTRTETKPHLFDAAGASAFVDGVKTERWFKDQARAGAIDAYQLGQTWCFDKETLLRLIAENFCPAANYGRKAR